MGVISWCCCLNPMDIEAAKIVSKLKKTKTTNSFPQSFPQNLVGGLNPSEKYEFVSWDDDIPNINSWKNHPNVPNHQPAFEDGKCHKIPI